MISIQTDRIDVDTIKENKLVIWKREIPMSLLFDHTDTLKNRLDVLYDQQQSLLSTNDEPKYWPNYIVGILSELINKIDTQAIPMGFNVVIISDVPCNKGLASSAALEVAVANAGN